MSHEKMADLFHFHYLGSLYSQLRKFEFESQ